MTTTITKTLFKILGIFGYFLVSCSGSSTKEIKEKNSDVKIDLTAKLEEQLLKSKFIEPFCSIKSEMEKTAYYTDIDAFKKQSPKEHSIYKYSTRNDFFAIENSILRLEANKKIDVKRLENLDTTAMIIIFKNGSYSFDEDFIINVYNHTNEATEADLNNSDVILNYIFQGCSDSFDFSTLNSSIKVQRIEDKLQYISNISNFIFLEPIYFKEPVWIKEPELGSDKMGEFKSGELFLKAYYFNKKSNRTSDFYVRVGNSMLEFGDLNSSLYSNVSYEILKVITKTLAVK